jgi:hypothetical protein
MDALIVNAKWAILDFNVTPVIMDTGETPLRLVESATHVTAVAT